MKEEIGQKNQAVDMNNIAIFTVHEKKFPN